MGKRKFTETNEEIIKRWRAGDVIWTAELGGMGPGYEQAIQVLLFEIMSTWNGPLPEPFGDSFPEEFTKHVDRVVHGLTTWGFTGAQVGAAKSTAWQFMKFGYAEMLNKLPGDRRIMVSNSLIPGKIDSVQTTTTV
jgi:hypothetical protein